MEIILLDVEGMSCGHCKMAVHNAVTGINGVKNATVDLETGRVTVTCERGMVSKEDLKKVIEEEGYLVI